MTKSEILHNTGKVLKQIRRVKDLGQKQVCAGTGINITSYSKLESCNTTLRITDLSTIAKFYEIPAYLLCAMIFEGNIAALYNESEVPSV